MKASAFLVLLFVSFTLAITPCSGEEKMDLTSPAFKDNGKIPTQYTMPGVGGKNLSIPLKWKNPPEGTKSFALSIVDPHPVARNWTHWLVINIPAGTTSMEEGASKKNMPPGSAELKSSFGDVGYGGPQPPKGTGDHPYVVTLYALDTDKLELGTNTTLAAFREALKGKVLGESTITGYFGQ